MHPRVAAMIDAIQRERHPEDVFFRLGSLGERMVRDQFGVRLALAAIECVGAFAVAEFAGEHVTALAVARGEVVEIRVPADSLHLARTQRAAGTQGGVDYRGSDNHHDGVERAHENHGSGVPVKSVVPRQHRQYLPTRAGSSSVRATSILSSRSSGNNWK